jgi:hypothetical protein
MPVRGDQIRSDRAAIPGTEATANLQTKQCTGSSIKALVEFMSGKSGSLHRTDFQPVQSRWLRTLRPITMCYLRPSTLFYLRPSSMAW